MKKITKSIIHIIFVIVMACIAGCSPEDDRSKGEVMGAVDLGLPSGTLWAERNVGATVPEDYGDYFAWGENHQKMVYNWRTYIYYNIDSDVLTKYYNSSEYGCDSFCDNLIMLQTGDDAAAVQWGAGWRTPSKAEWDELCQHTTSIWTVRNGERGLLFIALNGNELFLPAAGYRWNKKIRDEGNSVHYWSSSLYTDYPYYAWCLRVDSENCLMYGSSRSYGKSVRAVRSAYY